MQLLLQKECYACCNILVRFDAEACVRSKTARLCARHASKFEHCMVMGSYEQKLKGNARTCIKAV